MKKEMLFLIILALVCPAAVAQESDTRNDLSLTPWIDPDNPNVIRLDPTDATINTWNERNTKGNPKREPGPIDVQRYSGGFDFAGFPTFFKMPIALNTEDLKAGDVDVAIVGSVTDNNLIRGTSVAVNILRGFYAASSESYVARGGGKMEREKSGHMDQYIRTHINELNIVDYGNITGHLISADKSVEEIRTVLVEILDGDAIPLLVGGSHDNQYGLYLAAADKYGKKNFGVVHFDSHIDAVTFGFGFFNHNGNGIYRGLQYGLFDGPDLVQVGMTSGIPDDPLLEMMDARGVKWHYQAEIEKDGWVTVLQRVLDDVKGIENLVVSIDIDIMNSAYVPGTGARHPDGPTPSEMMQAIRALAIQNNVVAVEISEYNPLMDTSSFQTAIVVRELMRHFFVGLAAKKRGIKDPFYYHPMMVDDGR